MKKKLVTIIMGLSVALSATLLTYAIETNKEINFPDLRTAQGTYYDYLTIVTTDGNEWLLDDNNGSKYISEGKAIFHDRENVIVLFDTMGTLKDITDDVILDVHSLDY